MGVKLFEMDMQFIYNTSLLVVGIVLFIFMIALLYKVIKFLRANSETSD